MATYTPNLNLYKPDASDPFGDFREKFNDNMDILDNGGGGGGGGHTIYDENGSAMTQRAGLEFTGSVSVSDDSVNDKTIVDILGGNVYGAFIDTDRVIKATTTISGVTTVTYTATEDCVVTFTGVSDYEKACEVKIDNIRVWRNYNATNAGGIEANSTNLFLRKGQVISVSNGSSQYNGNYTVYGIKQGSNGIFAPVIYSDTERQIGVWRDNKPLYQKTWDFGSDLTINTNTWTNTPIVVADFNLEKIVAVNATNSGGAIWEMIGANTDQTYVQIYHHRYNAPISIRYLTLQYTKTTDVAGSGNWNTDGVPTVHYSTSEQVVGTWVDGKPVYERLIDLNGFSVDRDTWYSTNIPLSTYNIKNFVEQGSLYQDYNGFIQVFPCAVGIMASTYIGVDVKWDGGSTSRAFKYLKIRYTKTTD